QPIEAKIFFKTRSTVEGAFIKSPDYLELKRKNFWRIVSRVNLANYRASGDINLSRIFNGSEFVKLSPNDSARSGS
ncbi:MAG TPA: hypothetical protein VKQ52_21360, partial [Puia sp.]|nr:hypothetical protein [Puia sp.]